MAVVASRFLPGGERVRASGVGGGRRRARLRNVEAARCRRFSLVQHRQLSSSWAAAEV